MTTSDHFRYLEGLFHTGPYNVELKPKLTVSDGTAVITLEVRPDMFHGNGVVHGSFPFRLLDDAATFACMSQLADEFTLTASFTINFLRPAVSGTLTATGRVVNAGRRLMMAEAELRDENGRLLAKGSGTFMRNPNITTN